MPTLLTNAKMAPELAARVESSLRGRKVEVRGPRPKNLRFLLRLAIVVMTAAAITTIVVMQRRLKHELDTSRDKLLTSARAEAAQVTPDQRLTVHLAELWLARLAGPYEGDLSTPGWQGNLGRKAIYVRGDRDAFTSDKGTTEAARDSMKESFLLCLFAPPESREQKKVLARVHAAYQGGADLEDPTSNVRRLGEAKAGLPFLEPAFADSVVAAPDAQEVDVLRARFGKAPLARAKEALRAEILLVVMDEPESGTGSTELDGERAHDIRFALVDLRANKVLARARKHVDPSWITGGARSQYARGLDSCTLAMDVREAGIKKP